MVKCLPHKHESEHEFGSLTRGTHVLIPASGRHQSSWIWELQMQWETLSQKNKRRVTDGDTQHQPLAFCTCLGTHTCVHKHMYTGIPHTHTAPYLCPWFTVHTHSGYVLCYNRYVTCPWDAPAISAICVKTGNWDCNTPPESQCA